MEGEIQGVSLEPGIGRGTLPWKRALDLAVIALLAPILLVLLGVVVLWSVTVSTGPAFFRQERVGKRGKIFTMYKIRTMHCDVSPDEHRKYMERLVESGWCMRKMDDRDARLIPGARLLRASGLDELPQVFNVLRGEMSLIGPRPCIPYESDHFSEKGRRRFDMLPGITGLWQVNGKNSATFRQMSALDIYYSRHVSLSLDIAILARTPGAVVREISGMVRGSFEPRDEAAVARVMESGGAR